MHFGLRLRDMPVGCFTGFSQSQAQLPLNLSMAKTANDFQPRMVELAIASEWHNMNESGLPVNCI